MGIYSFVFRATIPVEPFRFEVRDTEFETNNVSVFIYADDPTVEQGLNTTAHKVKRDGTPGIAGQYEVLSWEQLPTQAKDAVRAAYADAVANVTPTLQEA